MADIVADMEVDLVTITWCSTWWSIRCPKWWSSRWPTWAGKVADMGVDKVVAMW